ncbi:hypothetical protein GQ457_06G009000 [Hibiscus cannabinus]
MNTESKFVSVFLMFSVLFLSSVSAQEVEEEREFDYLANSGKGPKHWGELKKEWSSCNSGKLQSPVDMSNSRVKVINKPVDLKVKYKPCAALLKNRGHDISIRWPNCDVGSIVINGTEYALQQAHWHSPSEHTINGISLAMELHMVHQNKQNKKMAVIGVLYNYGAPNDFLSKLTNDLATMVDQVVRKEVGVIDPNAMIKMGSNKYYTYMGSLTVPPCTEGVTWILNKEVGSVSKDQAHALRVAVHDYAEQNARPVQPLNDRKVELYSPN